MNPIQPPHRIGGQMYKILFVPNALQVITHIPHVRRYVFPVAGLMFGMLDGDIDLAILACGSQQVGHGNFMQIFNCRFGQNKLAARSGGHDQMVY